MRNGPRPASLPPSRFPAPASWMSPYPRLYFDGLADGGRGGGVAGAAGLIGLSRLSSGPNGLGVCGEPGFGYAI